MALGKEIKQGNGTTTNYHRILVISKNKQSKKIDINIASYVDKEYRDLEKEGEITNKEVNNIIYNFGAQLDIIDEDLSDVKMYERIEKELEFWNGAVEV